MAATPPSLLGSPLAARARADPGTSGLAADGQSLNALKRRASQDPKAAVKEAARQFEALFMREVLKSMREATSRSGLLDGGEGENLATDLLDQQLATHLTGLLGGLGAAIERQLSRQIDAQATPPASSASASGARAAQAIAAYRRQAEPPALEPSQLPARTTQAQADFVARHIAAAQAVAAEVGIPAAFMLGQAGHETGWGRSEIKHPNGQPSYNLFGIKAGPNWKGKVAEVTTTEYINGEPRKIKARFRAYDSYEEAFRDYARLMSQSSRYEKVLAHNGSAHAFATQMQQAGYATDPQYASKLSRAIQTTIHLQRALLASRSVPAQQG